MSLPQSAPTASELPPNRFRELLLEEAEKEIRNKTFIQSSRLNCRGKESYPELIYQAAAKDDTQWFIRELQVRGLLRIRDGRKEEGNVYRFVLMPTDAAESLAYAQMNRLKLRAHCRLMLENGHLEMSLPCRKREQPWEMETRTFNTEELLRDLQRDACQTTLLY
jgi:hypothetical protein